MKNRILSLLLALCLMVLALPMSVVAAETFTYKDSATTTTPSIGSEFEVVISLTNYDSLDAEIRGLQIDVTNIDTSVFEIVSHSTMISDASAASNKTSYSSSKNYIRLVYLQLAGSMDKSVTDVMKFRLKVKSDLTEGGSITLPITLKIGTMSENITLTDSLTINYQQASSSTVSVEVSWGSMEFTYDDGTWDDEKHKWVNNGWKPSTTDSNLITVKNTGSTDVKMELSYNPLSYYNGLSGTFVDSSNTEIGSLISLDANGLEQKYWFNISGTTETRWTDNYITVGTITLTITE